MSTIMPRRAYSGWGGELSPMNRARRMYYQGFPVTGEIGVDCVLAAYWRGFIRQWWKVQPSNKDTRCRSCANDPYLAGLREHQRSIPHMEAEHGLNLSHSQSREYWSAMKTFLYGGTIYKKQPATLGELVVISRSMGIWFTLGSGRPRTPRQIRSIIAKHNKDLINGDISWQHYGLSSEDANRPIYLGDQANLWVQVEKYYKAHPIPHSDPLFTTA